MAKKDWTTDMANKWKNYKPPIRPSKADLAVFEKYVKQKIKKYGKNLKILILGSTPEFRDLATKNGLVPYVVDYNQRNNIALGTLKEYKGKEILIKQDWRTLKLEDKFDLVFGEASLNMVDENGVKKILASLKEILKENGLILAKTWIKVDVKNLTFEKILKIYRTKFKKQGLDLKFSMNQYIHTLFYDTDHGSLYLQYLKMKDFYEKGIITKEEFDSFSGLSYEKTPLKILMFSKEDFAKIVKGYLKIKKVIIPKPIGINKIPIYVLSK